ncbi:hypothetical protein evm_001704 [Chilo suppressalis]|nr:hypothetical protein evm_001704 [Chilo suppressalis]
MYISLIGARPTSMTKSANMILRAYYMTQRKSECRDPSRTTVRMLDSLVRLSQAHCRLMYRTTILPMDAITAVSLVDLSMQDCTLDDTVDALHSTFQKHPDYEYLCTAKKLLTRLNLYEIWQEELLYYGSLLQVDHKTLEKSIEGGDCSLFTKYDYVDDENIPLSVAVVTSSYFNNKKSPQSQEIDVRKGNEDDFENANIKLVRGNVEKRTLINKRAKKTTNNKSNKTNDRKRKEIMVDVKPINNCITKRQKKSDSMIENSPSDNVMSENTDLLNGVPSVNDIFTELGIDLKFGNSESINIDSNKLCSDFTNHFEANKSKECSHKVNVKSEVSEKKTMDKLQKFKFVEKHDFSKFYDEKVEKSPTKHDVNIVKIEKFNSCTSNVSQRKSGTSNSQISIFESSDCDIDLDI